MTSSHLQGLQRHYIQLNFPQGPKLLMQCCSPSVCRTIIAKCCLIQEAHLEKHLFVTILESSPLALLGRRSKNFLLNISSPRSTLVLMTNSECISLKGVSPTDWSGFIITHERHTTVNKIGHKVIINPNQL